MLKLMRKIVVTDKTVFPLLGNMVLLLGKISFRGKLGQNHCFLYCVPSATYHQNPIFTFGTFGTRLQFFLRNVAYKLNFIDLKNET